MIPKGTMMTLLNVAFVLVGLFAYIINLALAKDWDARLGWFCALVNFCAYLVVKYGSTAV